MQLKDLVKPLNQLSDEELLVRLREVRARRTIERPAAKARVERAERKVSRGKVNALEQLLANMSEEERTKLLTKLEEEDGE